MNLRNCFVFVQSNNSNLEFSAIEHVYLAMAVELFLEVNRCEENYDSSARNHQS